MDKPKSAIAGNFDRAEKIRPTPDSCKDAVASRCVNARMMQNVFLIWLDDSIDENNENYQHTITQLRRVVNAVHPFTDVDQCVNFLTDIRSDNVFIIISGALYEKTVPLIHNITQLHTIFIFCEDKTKHEQWAKEWSKIKGVFSEISPICEAVKKNARQIEQNIISISFVNKSDIVSKKKLDQLDSTFMYTTILKEILLSIEFEEKHIEEFIDYCHDVFAGNEGGLVDIDELHRRYRDQTPIWWYTRNSFLYSTLNHALRLMDINIVIKMGCFVRELHRHIEQLHKEQFGGDQSDKSYTVYRGQGMSKADFNQLINTKGGLMSFNNFLSTSKDHDVSFAFAESNKERPDLIAILFVITIDPSKSTTPFASIIDVSYYKDEDEVLFSMHTIFRIEDIEPIDNTNRFFQVNLTLTTDNDKELSVLTDHIREETFPTSKGWYRLSLLLVQIGEFDKAQQVNEAILKQATSMNEKGAIYHQIATTKVGQGKFEEAITFNEKAREILEKTLPPNYPKLAMSYNNTGTAYCQMGEYSKARSCYEKALEIRQQSLPPNHSDLAMSYHNIGNVDLKMGEYPRALSSYEKALEINQKAFPPNHPNLAACYNNIGLVHRRMNDYSNALAYHEKALEIQQQSLPPHHPDLALAYGNIALIHTNTGEYSKAFSYYEQVREILEKTLPPTHPKLAMFWNNIGTTYHQMGEYSKALSCYEKALDIRQQSLPPNHSDLAMSYHNIGNADFKMGEYSRALSSYEKALEINQKAFPPNHPNLAASYNNIGLVHRRMSDYSNALSCHEKALEIQQQSLPPHHPDLADSYNNIGTVYYDMSEYSKALSYYEKALEIRQQLFSPNHPNSADSYNNIGNVYSKLGDYLKALSSYKKALEIGQQSLPSDHPDLADFYNNIGVIHRYMNDYSNALSYHEKAVEIQQRSFPPNHPNLARFYDNIGMVYSNMHEYSKALSYYEKALEINQKSLPPNHLDLATSYNDIGMIYNEMGEYSKALSFYERAVDIAKCSLPPHHPNLEKWRKNVEDAKKKL